MSRQKFIKESDECFYWRQKNNLPVHKDIFDIDEHIFRKWITENRHDELIAYILDEWDNGQCTGIVEEYQNYLVEKNLKNEYCKLWKGFISIRLDYLWSYISLVKKNSQFISSNPEVRKKRISNDQKFVTDGINQFIEGLVLLEEFSEIEKMIQLRNSIEKLEKPKASPTTDKRKIDEQVFWEIIEQSRSISETNSDFLEILQKKLESFKPNEIKNFNKIFIIKLNELNHWDLWALAYIWRHGCGDDEFDYFKSWVISKGKEIFDNIKNMNLNFDEKILDEDPQFEKFIYMPEKAYEAKTNNIMKPLKIKNSKMIGNEWNESELINIYPTIYKLFNY